MAPSKLKDDDFILTLSDNDSSIPEAELAPSSATISKKRKRDNAALSETESKKQKSGKTLNEEDAEETLWGAKEEDDGAMDSDFEFALEGEGTNLGMGEEFNGWNIGEMRMNDRTDGISGGDKKGVSIDDIIARRKRASQDAAQENENGLDQDDESEPEALELEHNIEDEYLAEDGFGMGVPSDQEESDEMAEHLLEDENTTSQEGSDTESVASPAPHPDDLATNVSSDDEDNHEDHAEVARQKAFFAPEEQSQKGAKQSAHVSFQTMSLSRPILRGLSAIGFTRPTPIQAKAIPVALLGKDVVGSAVTGSGKTAAFMIPILERLLYRPKKVPTSRVAVLVPTRELAIQCHAVATKLASFTDIKICLAVGGLSLKIQEAELKLRPDVIIATPGRFIDHMRNSASFTVDTLEILVLDEADRMLEAGFADELNEIINTIQKSRQTMLFSATMTSSVDNLIRVGLNRPVRLMVDSQKSTVGTLTQEFVRLRPGREGKKMGYLLWLCANTYTDRVIIFFRQKKEAHRARIVFGLLGMKAAELHGNMSQEQRITAIESFRSGHSCFLLATDLASRGLDIKNVTTVINYGAPQSHEIYLHRVGRTARAGRSGRSCTLAAEPDRKIVKAAVKAGRAQGAKIVSRIIDAADVDKWQDKVDGLEEEIEEVLKEEKEDKVMAQAEMEVKKGENMVEHEDEIKGRPRRTWFESEADKRAAKRTGRMELNGEAATGGKKKGQKLSNKMKKKLDDGATRKEGKVWKKGRAERDGKGAVANGRSKESSKKKVKGGKPASKRPSRTGPAGRRR